MKLDKKRLIFLDLETSGLDPFKHEILSVGICAKDKEYHYFRKMQRPKLADKSALDINRYDQIVWDQKSLEDKELIEVIAPLLRNRIIVGSNPTFDIIFMHKWFNDMGVKPNWFYKPICVAALHLGRMSDQFLSLKDLCKIYGVKNDNAHDALSDARAAKEVYQAIVKKADEWALACMYDNQCAGRPLL